MGISSSLNTFDTLFNQNSIICGIVFHDSSSSKLYPFCHWLRLYDIVIKFLLCSQAQIRQQGEFESLHRDLMVAFGSWEFDPLDLQNPFPNKEGSVHLWHGDQDGLVPVSLQRYICSRLPWIHYHELPGAGHLLLLADGMSDTMVKDFLLGQQ